MIYSNSCSYAIQTLTRLALLRPDGYVMIEELCAGTDLPRHFVAKILQNLVRQGLLTSAKGRGGGFALKRPPSQISLYDIMAAVDGDHTLDCCSFDKSQGNDGQPCAIHKPWAPIRSKIASFLVQTNLQDMSQSLAFKLKSLGQKVPQPKRYSKPLRISRK